MMVQLSFTNAPLIGQGEWVGFDNYRRLLGRPHVLAAPSGTPSTSCC